MERHTDGIKPCRNSVTGFAFVPAAAAGFAFQLCFLLSNPPAGSRWQHRQRLQSKRKGLAWKGSDSNEFVFAVPGWKLWWKHSWNFKLWSFFLEFASWILFLESSVAAFISQKFSHRKAIVTELKWAKPYDKSIVKSSHVSQKTNGFKAIYQRSFGLNHTLIFSASYSHFTARHRTSALCRNTRLAGVLGSWNPPICSSRYNGIYAFSMWKASALHPLKTAQTHESRRPKSTELQRWGRDKPSFMHRPNAWMVFRSVGVRKENDQRKQPQGSHIKYIYGTVR